ncbi:hypothetical protein [Paenibacillus polymyxa]|uniref:hypothetical protein n=1 Tax=Paenibacillus polymyxa TaxID=1406 RepID=UPI00287FC32D|nr:hypothetical protein [Paenibacillus polymyxa]
MLCRLQSTAKIIRPEYGEVDPKEILSTHRFDFETASQAGSSKQLHAQDSGYLHG